MHYTSPKSGAVGGGLIQRRGFLGALVKQDTRVQRTVTQSKESGERNIAHLRVPPQLMVVHLKISARGGGAQ